MAMNMDAVLRIAAKVVGLEDLGALQRGLVGVEKAAGETQQAFKAVIGSASWQAAAAGALAFAAGMGIAVKAAMDFESSMADVRKVVNGIDTPEAFKEIKQEIIGLSREMPIAADGFAAIYAAAGQSGIAKEDLREFAVEVAQTAIAFDMTAEQAGIAMAQIRSALGLTTPQLRQLTDAMNELSNRSRGALSASQLVDFTVRVGSIGKLAGFTGEQIAGFGAAMIQSGQQADVAATGFRGLLTALSKGQAMTDKQVGALRRLGFSLTDAKDLESQLTRVAETESRRRLDIARQQGNETVRVAEEQARARIQAAREETEQLSREISRRYRNQLQALQDNWDDQAAAQEEGIQDRADAQIKALEREQNALIKAAQERARINGTNVDAEVEQIRSAYDARIDAIRDNTGRELTAVRRADRDRQQAVRDRLQDQEELERKAAQKRAEYVEEDEQAYVAAVKESEDKRFKAVEAAERDWLEKAKANAKETGEARAAEDLQAFADKFSKDAKGTTIDILKRLAALPRAKLISTLTDLGGEETARSVAVLVGQIGNLEAAMAIAEDTAGNAGSKQKEYAARTETTANQLQLLNNKLEALQIAIGDSGLEGLGKAAKFLGELADGAAKFAEKNPGLTTALVAIGGVASALVIAAPGILAAITLIGKAKLAIVGLNLGGLIAGWLPAVVGFVAKAGGLLVIFSQGIIIGLQAALAWIGSTFVPALLAFFSGPVGWTVLAIAAVVAMVALFREPLMQFFSWAGQAFGNWVKSLWQWGEPIRQFWLGLWNQLVQATQASLNVIGGFIRFAAQTWWALTYQLFIQPWINIWNLLKGPVLELLQWMGGVLAEAFANLTQLAYALYVKPWVDLWQNVLRQPVISTLQWLGGIWKGISDTFRRVVAQPISQAWTAVVQALPTAMQAAANFVGRVWNGVITSVRNAVRGLLLFVANSINSVTGAVNNLIRNFNNLPGPDIPLIGRVTVPAFAEGGYVRRPTLGLVGEAGPEYIIPASKMQAASERFLSGQRGADVLRPSKSSGRTTTAGTTPPAINITTGPVLEFNGERYVTVRDFEKGMRMTAEGVIGRLRTPAARIALGR
jgi:hypothetical protein